MALGSVPYEEYVIPWEGDGPAQGGAQDSDGYWGENQLVATGFSVQPVRVFWAPKAPVYADYAALQGEPGANMVAETAMPNPPLPTLSGPYTDDTPGYGYGSVPYEPPLTAPPIPTGDTWMRGGY